MNDIKNSDLEYVHEILQLARGFISRKAVWTREEVFYEEDEDKEGKPIDKNGNLIDLDCNIIDENGYIIVYLADRNIKQTALEAINDASYELMYLKNWEFIRKICCLLIYKRILQYTGDYDKLVSDIDDISILKIEDTIKQWNKTVGSHKDVLRTFDEAISIIDIK